MLSLHLRMMVMLGVLFGVVYAVVVMLGTAAGITEFSFYFLFAAALMFLQYMIGPKMVEWSMRVKYVSHQDQPRLYEMVQDLSNRAKISMPKIGISRVNIPNAFAFGRSIKDGRVCVTQRILELLNDEELKAVLAHELSHIKNRDMLTITLLSIIPMIMYRLAWHFLFFGRRRNRDGQNTVLIGVAALVFYFITNLLVLYASRIREYFADRGAIALGSRPEVLASALYKLVYGSARIDKQALKEAEGFKAFFLNDPSKSVKEIKELSQIDSDRSGTIDSNELLAVRNQPINLTFGDKLMEFLSTHPNMLKRIKQLSQYG